MEKPWKKYAPQAGDVKPWERYSAPAPEAKEGLARTVFDQGMQGATFGFADEITDRLGAAGAALLTDQTYDDLYDEARQLTNERQARQLEQRPGASIASNIAGGLLTGAAGATTKAGAAIGSSLRTGNAAARIAKGALAGATSGGVYGLGAGAEGERLQSAGQGALYGGIAGAAIPAIGAAGSRLNTKTTIPTSDEIRKHAGDLFQQAERTGGILKPEFTDKFVDVVERMKPQTEIGQIVGGDSAFTKVVDKLSQIRGRPMTLNAAQELDELLGEAIDGFIEMGRPTKQGKKLIDIQSTLRNMIDTADENLVVGGKGGFQSLKEARKMWSTSYKMGDIERIIQRAEMYDQPATAIKTGFRTLYNNPNKMRGYSDAERQAIKKAAETGVVSDLLRTAGSRLVPIVAGASTGGLGTTAAAAAGSMASRGIAARMQVGRAENAARAVAERSGLVKKEQRIKIPQNWKEALRLSPRTARQAENQETKMLPSPKYNDEFVADSLGNVRQARPDEVAGMNATRQREVLMGMEPGTRMNIIRREAREKFGPIWDEIEKGQQERIAFEINTAYRQNPQASLNELIDQARANAEELFSAKGEQFSPGAMGSALLRAKKP